MKDAKPNALRDAALEYADLGLPVFPCAPGGKSPVTDHGFHDATTDAARIEQWWTDRPTCNIGIPTGTPSGLLVVDIDKYKPEYRPWPADGDELPVGCIVQTPRGGEHYVCQHVEGARNTESKLAPGVDVRAAGGYFLVPPSAINSKPYALLHGSLAEAMETPAPPWLRAILVNLDGTETKPSAAPVGKSIPEGQRNAKLTSMAGTMRQRGADAAEIEPALQEMNRRRCRPPLPEAEVRKIAQSVGRYPPGGGNGDGDDGGDDGLPNDPTPPQRQRKGTACATILMNYVNECTLFHTYNGRTFAQTGRRLMCVAGRGGDFRPYLVQRYLEKHKKPPTTNALQVVIEAAIAKALFGGPLRQVHLRTAEHDDRIYIDLGRPDSTHAIEIDATGWRIVPRPPVLFERTETFGELVVPAESATPRDLGRLFDLFPMKNTDIYLLVAWFLCAMRPGHPYPVLNVLGEPGSGKTTATKFLRKLIDPAGVDGQLTAGAPRDSRDVFAGLKTAHVMALDNLSGIPPWMSDLLSATATGSGQITKKLYTDSDVSVVEVRRPIILNGISTAGLGGDLQDRCIVLEMQRPKPLIDERGWWHKADDAAPWILGALLACASTAIKNLPTTKIPPDRRPRMLDASLWVLAAEKALHEVPQFAKLSFLDVYAANRRDAASTVVQSDLVGRLILDVAQAEWYGTAAALLAMLETQLREEHGDEATDRIIKSKKWPKNARALSGHLRKLAAQLRECGVNVTFGEKDKAKKKVIVITKTEPGCPF